MIIRKVSYRDYNKIKKLFTRNNLKMISNTKWKKLWATNPFLKNKKNPLKGWIIESNNKILAHLGAFPTKYLLKNKIYICLVAHNWVVDESYRYQSALLMKKLFESSKADFFLSTTTNLKAGNLMKALGAEQVASDGLNNSLSIVLNTKKTIIFFLKKKNIPYSKIFINFFTLIINFFFKWKIDYWKNKFTNNNIIKYSSIDSTFDNTWMNIKKLYKDKLLLQRDKNWLKWNLEVPLKEKKIWILLHKEKKKVNGYAICVENKVKGKFKRAYLIDLILLKKDSQVAINLIGNSIEEAKKRNCDIFEFRGFDYETRSYFTFFNPIKKKIKHNPFYYKSNNNKLDKILKKEDCWFPTYMDGDTIKGF